MLTNMKDLNLQSNPSMMTTAKELIGLRHLQVVTTVNLKVCA